jgi:two-component system, OmpR family, phosphate regulon sensor histidine kinase PhoR
MGIIITHTRKWLIATVTFFLFFAALLIVSEYLHEKKFRIGSLNEKLDSYATITERFIEKYRIQETGAYGTLDSLITIIPDGMVRITLIDRKGTVLFDSQVAQTTKMVNHLSRPEIQAALLRGIGTAVRTSETTHVKYYYYAKRYDTLIVRVSAIYDSDARRFIQPGRIFLVTIVVILLLASLAIILVNEKFGKTISTLKEFAAKALDNKPFDKQLVFPENELGNIGQEIMEIYQKLSLTKEELISEKAKLIRHLNMLDEGIAIFSKDKVAISSNNHFIRFLNYINDARVFTADEFFRIGDFTSLFGFLNKYLHASPLDLTDEQPTYEINLSKGGKHFSVKSIVFQDRSFEVSIHDITKPTKRKILKQQITENIAHELKTPVSSIKGFLETILQGKTDNERTADYIRRAYTQSCRLADLIHDISVLTKMEEAASLYHIEKIDLGQLIRDITGEIEPVLTAKNIKLGIQISDQLHINGNAGLLYSIFRNLFDNAADHGGNDTTIGLDQYLTDEEFYYFSFYDTGVGVPAEDLPRLFERFYRVEKGRDRKKGGTGLGLAIVKNAVQFHKGEISVKNRTGGGLEFQFALARDISHTNGS